MHTSYRIFRGMDHFLIFTRFQRNLCKNTRHNSRKSVDVHMAGAVSCPATSKTITTGTGTVQYCNVFQSFAVSLIPPRNPYLLRMILAIILLLYSTSCRSRINNSTSCISRMIYSTSCRSRMIYSTSCKKFYFFVNYSTS
jgi:hypothetical protein